MPVRVIVDENNVIRKIVRTVNNGLGMLSSEILRDCNEFCKEDTGMLIASSYIHSDLENGKLVWQTPYAARQYYEIPTAYHDVNGQATWRWCEVAKQHYGAEWERKAKAIARLYG